MVVLVAALKIYAVSEGDMFFFAMPSGILTSLFSRQASSAGSEASRAAHS